MVEIEGKILNTSISILIDPGAFQSYVPPKIVDLCKLGKVKHDKPWMLQLAKRRPITSDSKHCDLFSIHKQMNLVEMIFY